MDKETQDRKVRPTLRCVSINELIWQQLKTLAGKASETKSSYIRQLIKKQYKKERGNELISTG